MDSTNRTKRNRRSTPDAARKWFTVEHANRALPLVRRIVSDIVAQYKVVSALQDALVNPADGTSSERLREMKDDADNALDHLRELVEELREVGCELKDWQRGLVDFPCQRDGREILLCWQLGEDSVEHWHESDAGFSGRQLITADF
ncbi:MAG: DUF2203 domain-containing protein [Phycisphaerae bacterium]|nr:DUF2203 domain-containing protein [Phycisphaerae bacterium]